MDVLWMEMKTKITWIVYVAIAVAVLAILALKATVVCVR